MNPHTHRACLGQLSGPVPELGQSRVHGTVQLQIHTNACVQRVLEYINLILHLLVVVELVGTQWGENQRPFPLFERHQGNSLVFEQQQLTSLEN
ncbi:UNVERIFIED_CONTAM: hypothetical protein ACS92_07545 [Bacillus cereus]